jgi:hypothetical protein
MTTSGERRQAKFDEYDHCSRPGWATYQGSRTRRPPMWRPSLRCWLGRHVWPSYRPEPLNGHSPANYDRCSRCCAFVKWYVDGQHRWGGIDRYFANLPATVHSRGDAPAAPSPSEEQAP